MGERGGVGTHCGHRLTIAAKSLLCQRVLPQPALTRLARREQSATGSPGLAANRSAHFREESMRYFPTGGPITRRAFLRTAGLTGGVVLASGWRQPASAQGLKTITASHSVST